MKILHTIGLTALAAAAVFAFASCKNDDNDYDVTLYSGEKEYSYQYYYTGSYTISRAIYVDGQLDESLSETEKKTDKAVVVSWSYDSSKGTNYQEYTIQGNSLGNLTLTKQDSHWYVSGNYASVSNGALGDDTFRVTYIDYADGYDSSTNTGTHVLHDLTFTKK